MPRNNALATAHIIHKHVSGKWNIELKVWSHSYDHPTPKKRSAMVSGVQLINLPAGPTGFALKSITDRYGVDQASLWTRVSGALGVQAEGFTGYTEYENGGVEWSSQIGVYDERCLMDPRCDALRLQTYVPPGGHALTAYNYVVGPLTFSFSLTQFSPSNGQILLTLSQIGGNGGDPANRSNAAPHEQFVIGFP